MPCPGWGPSLLIAMQAANAPLTRLLALRLRHMSQQLASSCGLPTAAAAAAAAARGAWAPAPCSSSSSGSSWGDPHGQRWASSFSNVIASEAGKTRIQGYLPNGFVVNNARVQGPIVCLPDMWLIWGVKRFQDISPASLSILQLMAPSPEVLIIGSGSAMHPLNPGVLRYCQQAGIAVEVLDTRNALSYFNFMNDEGRVVVAALLPYEHHPDAGAGSQQEAAAAARLQEAGS